MKDSGEGDGTEGEGLGSVLFDDEVASNSRALDLNSIHSSHKTISIYISICTCLPPPLSLPLSSTYIPT